MICHPCRYQLEKSYAFKKKCENSDIRLRQHLKIIREKIGTDEGEPMEEDVKEQMQKADAVNQLLEDLMGTDDEPPKESIEEVVTTEPQTEQELLGVAQVAYIQPDTETLEEEEEQQPENITLPLETEHMNKEACTLTNTQMKKEIIEPEEEEEEEEEDEEEEETEEREDAYFVMEEEHDQEQGEDTIIDDQDLDAIANAVKATLSSHPGINTSGDLQMKVSIFLLKLHFTFKRLNNSTSQKSPPYKRFLNFLFR